MEPVHPSDVTTKGINVPLSIECISKLSINFVMLSLVTPLPLGFLDLQLKPWIRNFLTRCLAIVPSLIVALVGGSTGAGIIIASMILSFELPFALNSTSQVYQ
ncbi:hypothetical protein RJ640_023368 [Escallonia rubra]|uniref:Uncharacterized protein n=1 Tax=Escallonia rubra TaxID=112253 RepID=A0AA88UIH9_9ASTE|nr:hypothetical protein RJ640_023368 [Escallonia rubra]